MGEKVYKPIVKDGDHLIRSKDNPDRVRGLRGTKIIRIRTSSSGKSTMLTIYGAMIMIRTLMKNGAFN